MVVTGLVCSIGKKIIKKVLMQQRQQATEATRCS